MEGAIAEPSAGLPSRGSRAILLLAAVLPLLLAAVPRDLWAPDEPRYGRIAHEMAAGGDALVPRLNGLPYAEKPPLVFWAMAGSERLAGGPSPLAARLPSAVLAALAVLATASLARRWFGDRDLAATAALLFSTTGLVLWNAPRAALDLPLAAFSIVALEGATASWVDRSWAGALRMGVGLGLGLLAKGPHALYAPLAGLAGGAVALGRATPPAEGRTGSRMLRVFAGVVLGAAILLAWLLPALARAGDELTARGERYGDRLLGQIGSRVAGEDEPHDHGPLYLVGLLLLTGLPWTWLWLARARRGFAAFRRDGDGVPASDRFGLAAAWAGILLPLLLLSIPASKRENYLVPLLPLAAILAAHGLHRMRSPSRLVPSPAVARRVAVGLGAAAVVLAAVLAAVLDDGKSFARAAEVARREAPDAAFAVAGTDDVSPLWAFGSDRAAVVRRHADLDARLATGAPRVVVLSKGKFWRERPGGLANVEAARVVWEGSVGATDWILVTNAKR
jgi:4-amino-4-deoxy-L-arabinose transferase-like glycosyltransferase